MSLRFETAQRGLRDRRLRRRRKNRRTSRIASGRAKRRSHASAGTAENRCTPAPTDVRSAGKLSKKKVNRVIDCRTGCRNMNYIHAPITRLPDYPITRYTVSEGVSDGFSGHGQNLDERQA